MEGRDAGRKIKGIRVPGLKLGAGKEVARVLAEAVCGSKLQLLSAKRTLTWWELQGQGDLNIPRAGKDPNLVAFCGKSVHGSRGDPWKLTEDRQSHACALLFILI